MEIILFFYLVATAGGRRKRKRKTNENSFSIRSRKRGSPAQQTNACYTFVGEIRDVKLNRRQRFSNEFVLFTFRRIMRVRNDLGSRSRVDSGRFYNLSVRGPAESDFCVEGLYRKHANLHRGVLFRTRTPRERKYLMFNDRSPCVVGNCE